jgi:N-acylneuraminate cytidylyltransferase
MDRKNIAGTLSYHLAQMAVGDRKGYRLIDYVVHYGKVLYLKSLLISTDDEEIAEVARQYGAKVPFMRTPATANDYATLADVMKEVLTEYKNRGQEFDNSCLILATCPMLQSQDISSAYNRLTSSDFTMVYPVVLFSYPIWRCLDLAEDGSMRRHWPEFENSRSQDLPKQYHDTGTFYWYKNAEWLAGNVKIGGIEVDETTIQDIDTETDWKLAEMKYKLLFGNDKA